MDSLAELIAHRAQQLGDSLPLLVPPTPAPSIPIPAQPQSKLPTDHAQLRAALLHIRHDIDQLLKMLDLG